MTERNQNKLSHIFISTILFSTPFALYYVFERPVVSQRYFFNISSFSLLLFFCISFIFSPQKDIFFSNLKKPFFLIVSFNIFIQILSIVNSPAHLYSFKSLLSVLAGFSFFAIIYSIRFSDNQIRKFYFFLTLSGLIVSIYGIMQYFGLEFLQYQEEIKKEKYHLLSFLGHPNYVAAFVAPLFFISMANYLNAKNKSLKYFYLVSSCVFIFTLCLSGARGAWLATVFSAICIMFLILITKNIVKINLKKAVVFIGCFAAIILVGVVLVGMKYKITERLGEKEPVLGRFYSWMIANEMWKTHPILGIGAGNFEAQFWNYAYEFQKEDKNKIYEFMFVNAKGIPPGYAHNEFIQTLAENGALGFISLLLIFIAAADILIRRIRMVLREQEMEEAIFSLGILGALIVIFIDAQFNFPLHQPVSSMLFWFILSRI